MHLPNAAFLVSLLDDHLAPWLVTYGIHSSIAILLGLLLARWMKSSLARARLWKILLLGPLLTASLKLEVGAAAAIADVPQARLEMGAGFLGGRNETPDTARTVATPVPAIEWVALSSASPLALPVAQPVTQPVAGDSPATPWTALAAGAWCLLAAGAVLQLLLRRRRLVRCIGERNELSSGELHGLLQELLAQRTISHAVKLTVAKGLTSPIAIGRAEICVPPNVETDLGRAEQRCLLAHELAHLARRDPFWLLVSGVLARLFFFQPLLRCVRGRLQEEMEFLADESAVGQTQDSVHMARCLERFAEWVETGGAPVLEPNMAGSSSQLVRRIEAVLQPRDRAKARRTSRLVAVCGALGLVLLSSAGPRLYGASLSPASFEAARAQVAEALGMPQESPGEGVVSAVPEASAPLELPPRLRRVLPGDRLIFSDDTQPELNLSLSVPGGGEIFVPRLGSFLLNRMTAPEIEAILRKRLLKHYDSCDLRVQHLPKTHRFHIYGAVRGAGARERGEYMRVFEAVMAEQTNPGEQDLSRVTLYRPDPVQPFIRTIDVLYMLRTGDSGANVALRDGDHLLIPWGRAQPNSLDADRAFQTYTSPFALERHSAPLGRRPDGSYDMAEVERRMAEDLQRMERRAVEARFDNLVKAAIRPALGDSVDTMIARMRHAAARELGEQWRIQLREGRLSVRYVNRSGESMMLADGPTLPGPVEALHAWLKAVQDFRVRASAAESERLNPGIRPAHPRFREVDSSWSIRLPDDVTPATRLMLLDACRTLGLDIESVETVQRMPDAESSAALQSNPAPPTLLTIYVSNLSKDVDDAQGTIPPVLHYEVVQNSAAGSEATPKSFETTDLALLEAHMAGLVSAGRIDIVLVIRREGVQIADTEWPLRSIRSWGFSTVLLRETF